MGDARLLEVETDPEWSLLQGEPGEQITTWHGKMSVDLTWVAGAQPYQVLNGHPASAIMMAGSGQWRPINIPYADFMKLWTEARNER